MAATALELKNAIAAALSAATDVTDIVGVGIYEYAQTGEAEFPFVTIGDGQESDDSTDCLNGSDAFLDIHAWSRPDTPAFDEAMTLADAVRRTLHNAELTLATQRCVLIEHRITRYLRETDPPPVFHAAITFHAVVEES
jgi:hypothetical protein